VAPPLFLSIQKQCNKHFWTLIIFLSFVRNTIIVLSSFLDAFQKIADAATNTKGKRETFPLFFRRARPVLGNGRARDNFYLNSVLKTTV
jgi:hypothetical protein